MSNWFTESTQFKRGMKVEDFLDNFFASRGFAIKKTTPIQERKLCLGDRIFTRGDSKQYIEYKSGIQTFYTGNVFLETVSVDTNNTPGWVYTCKADYVFYATLLNGKILVFKPDKLREAMPELKQRFREVSTSNNQNKGYKTWGVIVPLHYAEEMAHQVIEIEVMDESTFA